VPLRRGEVPGDARGAPQEAAREGEGAEDRPERIAAVGLVRIARLSAAALDVPLRKPFGIARGAQEAVRNVLVTIELADGTRGYGEGAPFPAFNGETQEGTLAAIEAARPAVEAEDARRWRKIARGLKEAIGASGAGRCAIETALLDALARRAGISLHTFFGGAEDSLVTDVTIPTGTRAEAAEDAAAWQAAGFSRLKVKIGGGGVEEDLERVLAIHDAAPRASLILDGNGGLTAEAALRISHWLEARGIRPVLFEQPVARDDWRGLAEVARSCGFPVAADESAASTADVLRIAESRAAQVVNVKPMKAGLVEALEIALVARAAGLRLMIGGMVEAKLAMSASACLAAGLGGFDFVDLDTPLFLAENPFDGGYAQEGERLDLGAIGVGHGVVPRGLAGRESARSGV
jgi:L-alanine-DL-glutamate epimerase-like enolase superfamily enzyme